jgi:GT2 family glycosyltransferase
MDSDCIATDQNWINELVVNLEKDVGSVGGPNIVYPKDNFLSRGIGILLSSFLGGLGARNTSSYKEKKEVTHNPPCNSIVPKSIFEETGGFDSSFKVAEDLDFDYRLKELGYRLIYSPNAKVYHNRRSSLKKFIKQMYQYGYWRCKVGKKHPRLIGKIHYLPLLFLFLFVILPLLDFFYFRLFLSLIVLYLIISIFFSIINLIRCKDLASVLIFILAPLEYISYGLGFFVAKIEITKMNF